MKDEGAVAPFILHLSSFILPLLVLSCSPPGPANMTDDLGRPVHLPAEVGRIVTLAPNLTEIVCLVGAEGKLVGIDDFSDYPPEVKGLPTVGGMQPSIEKIVALRPDLVLATTNGNHPNLAAALDAVHIPLFVVRTDRLDDVPHAVERIGTVSGLNASHMAAQLREALARQRRTRSHPPRVLFAVWADPLYVAGKNTFTDDLLRLTGAVNTVPVAGWPQYSLESLAASPPDLVLYPGRSVSRQQVEKLLATAPALRRVRAVAVDENVFTRPGPRVAAAAAELNRIFEAWQ